MKRTFQSFALALVAATFVGCTPADPSIEGEDIVDEMVIVEPDDSVTASDDSVTTSGAAAVVETPAGDDKAK